MPIPELRSRLKDCLDCPFSLFSDKEKALLFQKAFEHPGVVEHKFTNTYARMVRALADGLEDFCFLEANSDMRTAFVREYLPDLVNALSDIQDQGAELSTTVAKCIMADRNFCVLPCDKQKLYHFYSK